MHWYNRHACSLAYSVVVAMHDQTRLSFHILTRLSAAKANASENCVVNIYDLIDHRVHVDEMFCFQTQWLEHVLIKFHLNRGGGVLTHIKLLPSGSDVQNFEMAYELKFQLVYIYCCR